MPQPYQPIPRARIAQTADMVRRAGADGALSVDGRLGAAALGTILTRCMDCRWPASCAASQVDHPGAGTPPDYCLNRERLGQMAAEAP